MERRRRWVRPLIGVVAAAVGLALTVATQRSTLSPSLGGSSVHLDPGGSWGVHPAPDVGTPGAIFHWHLPHLPHLARFHFTHEHEHEHLSHDEAAMAAMVDGAEHDLSNAEHHHDGDWGHEQGAEEEAHRDESHYGYGIEAARTSGAGEGDGGTTRGGDAARHGGGCPSLDGGGEVSVDGKVHKAWVMHTGGSNGQYAHMPSLARTSSGRLIAAWQGSKHGEGGNDQALYTSVALDVGGTRWAPPRRVGGGKHAVGARAAQGGARWGPTLFQHPRGGPLHMFYSEGSTCWFCRDPRCRVHMLKAVTSTGGVSSGSFPPGVRPAEWRAGGSVYMITSTDDGASWGPRKLVLSENHEGHIPKVVANPPIVLRNGSSGGEEWLLPYWRQRPRGPAQCKASGRDWAGVISSTDGGATWHAHGKITQHTRNPTVDRLIEGTLVPPPPLVPRAIPGRRALQDVHNHHHHDHHDYRHGGHHNGRGDHVDNEGGNQLLQLFRTTRNVTYACTSTDGALSWSRPFPLKDLPNPNTKLHAARLTGGQLIVAYNHHRYKFRQRSNLYVSVATVASIGGTYHVSAHHQPEFKVLAKLEGKFAEGVMFHYPQILQVGCTVHVIYGEHMRGIKLASFQLKGVGSGSGSS